jgi:LCP family protein required for cell wall assembly
MSMSQAQPSRRSPETRPDRRRSRRRTAETQRASTGISELDTRRRQRPDPTAANRRRSTTGSQGSDVAQQPKPSTTPRRPPALVIFGLGAVFGAALAGPLPGLVSHQLASLLQGAPKLAGLIDPLGLGQRRVLVLGTDVVGENTDVMFTVQVNKSATELTQVPRDTFIESDEHGILKANALYAVGGIEAVRRELSPLLSGRIDRYLKVNLRAVQRVAEALGGVEVDVPKRMYYVDNAQGLYIDLYPGRQLLQGESLEGFLRFRHDERGDLGRMERQKLVLAEVFRKLAQPTTLTRLPELMRIAGDDIKTDLSPVEMAQLLGAMATTELTPAQLAGREYWHKDLSYWMPESNTHYAAGNGDDPYNDGSAQEPPHS